MAVYSRAIPVSDFLSIGYQSRINAAAVTAAGCHGPQCVDGKTLGDGVFMSSRARDLFCRLRFSLCCGINNRLAVLFTNGSCQAADLVELIGRFDRLTRQ